MYNNERIVSFVIFCLLCCSISVHDCISEEMAPGAVKRVRSLKKMSEEVASRNDVVMLSHEKFNCSDKKNAAEFIKDPIKELK